MTYLADDLVAVVEEAAVRLRSVSDDAAAISVRPNAWSLKEILGHLIDSAANNHQRFVRAQQAAELTFPGYDQEAWVRVQGYRDRPWTELVHLWVLFNRHVAHAIRRMPREALTVPCRIGASDPVTLQFLAEDYLAHLRHHLTQIEERRPV